ncbi:multicopper oxidase domain-containing protein [Polaromonas eurypsychrophila]|uniref:multicopper oxidase domain-containing protein n=1 Tax=Polaromonas eurypsychrophila TaxID=1614635 RepID=UPI003570A36D
MAFPSHSHQTVLFVPFRSNPGSGVAILQCWFMYHCRVLEHENCGMMDQFATD